MNFSAETQDPHTFVIDVVNLIEHPFKGTDQNNTDRRAVTSTS